jgi:plastocyanin
MTTYARPVRTVVVLAIAVIALVFIVNNNIVDNGSGDDEDTTTEATETTTTEERAGGEGVVVEVSMTEYAFKPKNLTVSNGDTITAKNDGQIDHNYSVLGGGSRRCRARPGPWRIARCREGGSGSYTGDVAPGTTSSFPVDFRGHYDVICTIRGHAEKGMRGTLTIK